MFTSRKNNLHSGSNSDSIWKHFYGEYPKSQPQKGININAAIEDKECFIYNTIFIDITLKSAINFQKVEVNFLYSGCLFTNCSSDDDSHGTVYLYGFGSVIQHKSCGYKSITTSDYAHHSFVSLVGSSDNKNYLYECSFYDCGVEAKSKINYLYNGNIDVKSTNTSFCKSYDASGIYLDSPFELGNIKYSYFCNTTSNNYVIALFNKNFSFKYCNVLNNSQLNSDSGTFFAGYSTVVIEISSFLGNTGERVEFLASKLVIEGQSPGIITIKDSFCDRQVAAGFVTFENVKKDYVTSKYSYFYSYYCDTKHPAIKLIPITNSIQKSSNSVRRRR